MIARPKVSQNEWKTAEIGAFEVGDFALLSCPGAVEEREAQVRGLGLELRGGREAPALRLGLDGLEAVQQPLGRPVEPRLVGVARGHEQRHEDEADGLAAGRRARERIATL